MTLIATTSILVLTVYSLLETAKFISEVMNASSFEETEFVKEENQIVGRISYYCCKLGIIAIGVTIVLFVICAVWIRLFVSLSIL